VRKAFCLAREDEVLYGRSTGLRTQPDDGHHPPFASLCIALHGAAVWLPAGAVRAADRGPRPSRCHPPDRVAAQVRIATKAGSSPPPAGQGDEALTSLQQRIAKLGHALRMKYLKAKGRDKPPQVFDAWLVDRDPRNPEETTIEVRVLLTRDQLSDLRNALTQVLELAEEGVLSPRNFVAELKAIAAHLSRNQEAPAGPPGGQHPGRARAHWGIRRGSALPQRGPEAVAR
jgi:hypothetical protein